MPPIIVRTGSFKPSDPFGIYKDRPNPLDPMAPKPNAPPPQSAEELAQLDEIRRAEEANAQVDAQHQQLEAQKPGQYEVIDAAAYEAWRTDWEARQPGWLEDTARILGGSIAKGGGSIVSGLGNAITGLTNATTTPVINQIFNTNYGQANPLAAPAEWLSNLGEKTQEGVSFATREAIANSTPGGDILDPSSWTLGEAPSAPGYAALALDVFGQMVPVIAAAVVAGPAGGAIVGGMQGGGAAAEQAEAVIDQMAAEPGLLERESAYYREQIAAGASHDDALAATKAAAGQAAFWLTAPISGLGGFATAKIIDPATAIMQGKNIIARITGRAGLSALEEGTQEAAETMAANAGVNAGAGTDLALSEGTFGDFLLGALAGGGPGAVAGAFSGGGDPPEAPAAAPNATFGAPAAAAAPTAPVAPPAGPLTKAREYGMQQAPAAGAGSALVVNDPPLPGMGAGEAHGQTVTLAPNQAGIDPAMARVVLPDGSERVMGKRLLQTPQGVPLAPEPQGMGEAISVSPTETGKPQAGSRAIIEAPDMPAFNGTIEQYVTGEDGAIEAIVADDQGEVFQVPASAVRSLGLTSADIAAMERKENPPLPPTEAAPETGRQRTLRNADGAPTLLDFPDDTLAQLYDLGRERAETKRFDRVVGNSALKRIQVPDGGKARREALADALGVLPDQINDIADDYRYRAERAARSGTEGMASKMHGLNEERLKALRAERARAPEPVFGAELATAEEVRKLAFDTASESMYPDHADYVADRAVEKWEAAKAAEAAPADKDASWWDGMTPGARKAALASAGVKRSEKSAWAQFSKPIKTKLAVVRAEFEAVDSARAGSRALDEAAHQAATSPQNGLAEPSQAQKEAGNYKLGHHKIGGLDLSIENPAGSERKGTDKGGKPWSVTMESHYGYIKGTVGKDKDHIDVFVKPGTDELDESAPVFVVDQVVDGKFDEHKVMLGFKDIEEAREAYLENYSKGWKGLGGIGSATLAEFKQWLKSGNTSKPFGTLSRGPTAEEANPWMKPAAMGARASVVNGRPLAADPENTLLLMACGQAKIDTDKSVPLLELYNGPLWQDLRSKGGRLPERNMFVLSGKHGFTSVGTYSKPYEEKISSQKVDALIERGIFEGRPSEVRGGAGSSSPYAEVHRPDKPFTQVIIYGSGEYRRAFDFITAELLEAGAVVDGAPVVAAEGSILQQRKQFNEFLRTINDVAPAPPATNLQEKKPIQETDDGSAPKALANATAPEHVQIGVDDRELSRIVDEFNDAQADMMAGDHPISNVFQPPKKGEVVRLADKVKVFHKEHGWMTPAEAKAKLGEWKAHARAQGADPKIRSANGDKVVLSLFDLSGEWSRPWEEAGYQVYRFDIQADPEVGDVNNFSTEFFGDWFGDFEGQDIYAILAACPCTDFAVSGARHFAAKDADGRTVASVKLVHQTLRTIEYFKPAVWALENPVGRIQELGGLPPWRLSFDPNHLGEPYTKKTLIWGRFNGDLPIAPVEPTEGSKMWKQFGGKSQATKNARSVTPEGFSYGFFMANNAHDHAAMALANKFDRLDRQLIGKAIDAGVSPAVITEAVEDHYYMDLDDEAANDAIRGLLPKPPAKNEHPGLVVKNLRDGKERVIQPKGTKAPESDWKPIGKNKKGFPVYEDQNGVRSYVENGIRLTEAVRVDPAGNISVDVANRWSDYKPVDDAARTEAVKEPVSLMWQKATPAGRLGHIRKATGADIPDTSELARQKWQDLPEDLRGALTQWIELGVKGDWAPEPAADRFAKNKLFTADKVEAAKARLKSKINQLNSGPDPEILVDGMTIAGAYIEAGVRDFADYAARMTADFGEGIRPFLLSFWEAVRHYPGLDTEGMTPAAEAATIAAALTAAPEARDDRPDVQSAVEGPARAGAGAGKREPDIRPQPGPARADRGDLEAGKPQDVAPASDGGRRRVTRARPAAADVGGTGSPDLFGDAGDGRTGAGRKGTPDAGTGNGDGAGTRADASPVKAPASVSPANTGPGNFHIEDPLKIVGGGQVARFEKNRKAIELLNTLRDEGRQATREEQEVLAGYTGWGSFGQDLFQGTWAAGRPKQGWEARDKWLRDNLGQQEWESLQRSITNAHYTDPPTVTAMWNMVQRMGFNGGRVLEPSMGIGNFFGMMPLDLKTRSNLSGIELEQVTGDMAKLLYPDANISIMGYQESKTPDGFYDLVIGNWPFEDTVIADRRYNRFSPYLHDYFYLKALDQTRAGGLVVGITSKGTLDKKDSTIRAELAKKGELVAAFRLPSGAFEEYAGTAVVTDIIILRKREQALGNSAGAGWIKSVPYKTPTGEEVSINEYYVANPSHVIGTIEFGHGTTFRRPGMIVTRPADMLEQIKRITALVPEGAYKADSRAGKQISYITNHTDDREGALTKTKDGLFIVRGEHLAPAQDVAKYEVKDPKATAERVAQLEALIDMRKAYAELIAAERAPDGKPEPARKSLKGLYDAFVKAHGSLSDSYGLNYLGKIDDPFYPALAALEHRTDKGIKPAGILSASTIRAPRSIANPSVSDAFVLARNTAINPSLKQIAEIAKRSEAEVRAELLKSGAVFELPGGDIAPSDIYLSGNVREKMRQARAALDAGNTAMERNVAALEKVMPPDVPYYNIEVQMGASWVPTGTYAEYIAHMLNVTGSDGIAVYYTAGRWRIALSDHLKARPEARAGFGTEVYPFSKLLNAAISNQTVTIRKKDADGNEFVDTEATAEANDKVANIRSGFGDWLWSDPERRVELEAEYNEVRNAFASPSFDGSFLSFEGMALSLGRGPFDLREHQANAIWRALVMRRSLNAHEVGTGKTFTMGGIAVESRRYGIAKKPLIFAHNANSKSVAAEIQQMYPAAKVLYIDNLAPAQIDIKMRQIANDDWDAVVVPHSLISRFALTEETLMALAAEEIAAIEAEAYEAAKDDGVELREAMLDDEEELKKLRSPTAKDLVKMRNRIIENIKKQGQRASKEGAISFEELGIDMVMVDEVHEFKKPPFSTRMRIKGLNTQSSDKSIALAFLTRYIRSTQNGGNVHLFTGTPVTNTLTEVFHMMRYMMAEEMADMSVDQWDGWFGSFAKEVQDVELNAAAEYEAVNRLAGFINVPELRRMIGQYMDVVFAEDMPEMQPRKTASGKVLSDPTLTEKERAELLNGRTENAMDRPYKKVIVETADLTPAQQREFAKIQAYAQRWRQMTGKEKKDAMLLGAPESPIIYENLAAKASFDVRLMRGQDLAGQEGKAPDDPNSKPSRAIKNIVEIYRSHAKATQVVFTNAGLSTTGTRSIGAVGERSQERFKVFSTVGDIVERLVQQGIPRSQIAVVDGNTSKDKRKEIADAMNRADIRVVIGSTQSLGVGVNMQRNLRAMHHLDAPWMPGDLEQRNGRGQRQANQWNTVLEYRYITDRIDGRRWQVLAIKQRFINAFLKADDTTRIIEGDAASEEESDILTTFAEAAGDPRVLIREKLKKKIEQFRKRQRLHDNGVVDAARSAKRLEARKDELAATLKRLAPIVEKVEALSKATAGDGFSIEIDGKTYDSRGDAREAIDAFVEASGMGVGSDARTIGKFGGYDLQLRWRRMSDNWDIGVIVDGELVEGRTGSLNSLEISLRRYREGFNDIAPEIADAERSITRLRAQSAEPFHQAADLARAEADFDALEADLAANPVPPPAWLRSGAPVDTDVMWKGEKRLVSGHRWNASGWFVLTSSEAGPVEMPYLEVKDEQGMPLYEERPFVAPEVVEKKKPDEPDGRRNSIAYHGTPHDFDRFSSAHINSGEGNQSYGHGLYFTDERGVAEHYRTAIAGKPQPMLDGAPFHGATSELKGAALAGMTWVESLKSVDAAIEGLRKEQEATKIGRMADFYGDAAKWLDRNRDRVSMKVPGRLYTVEIPDADELLDWDKPLTEQSPGVRSKIEGLAERMGLDMDDLAFELFDGKAEDLRGEDLYGWFGRAIAQKNKDWWRQPGGIEVNDPAASALLREAGIPGHRYVGHESRKPNYVIYDDTRIAVLAKESRGRQDKAGKTPDTVRSQLRKAGLGPMSEALEQTDRLRIIRSDEAEAGLEGVQGYTDPDGTITLIADQIVGDPVAVLLHEAFHSGAAELLGTPAWRKLMLNLAGLYRQFEQSKGRARTFFDAARARVSAAEAEAGALTEPLRVEEFAAYAIEEQASAPAALSKWVDELIGAIKAWALKRFGRQLGAITPSQLKAIAKYALLEAVGSPSSPTPGMASRKRSIADVGARAKATITRERIGQEIGGRLTDLKPAALATVPLTYFSDLKRPGMVAVDQYLKVKRLMDAYRGNKHAKVDEVAQEWRKYARLGLGGADAEGRGRAAALADLMHETTLAGIDPSDTSEEMEAKSGYAALRARYLALPKTGQDLYRKVRDTYADQADELDAILLDNVRKTQEIAFRRAEDKYREKLAEIEASKLDKLDKSKARKDAEDAYRSEMGRATYNMKARLTKLRLVFEASRVPAPYFPLARFGKYFVTVRSLDGTVLSFSKKETDAERQRLERDMKQAYPNHTVESGLLVENGSSRDMMDPRIVAEIETLLGDAGVDSKVMDMIWQRYLETMPDLSARKRFIHRKGVAGFDGDALRTFASNQFHAAHQMARLKFGLELTELTNQAVDQAKKADDQVRAMQLANELRKRHEWVMNPTGSKLAQGITQTMFVWYLAATPAAAIINLSQTIMMGIPVLGARLGGITKAAAAIGKASADVVRGKGSARNAQLTDDEHRALAAFYQSGMIDRTQAHDLAGVGETGVAYSPWRHKVMSIISWAYHNVEVWNREVTALAAYRMAREQGHHEGKAIDIAHDLTWAAHFDYSNSSRPRFMQGDVAKVALVFQSHQVNMWYRLFRDIHQSVKGESPQARKEARYQLAGILGMMSLMGGMTGFFGYNVLVALAGLAFDDDDDPRTFKAELEGHIVDLFGKDLGGMVLKGVPGHLTGIDLTSRLGMPDFFIRAPDSGAEGRDWFQELIIGALGVAPSTLLNAVDGAGLIMQGDIARGVEVLAPKAIKDLLQATRYANEGVLSRKGDVVLERDQLNALDMLIEAVGFTPAKVAETYERMGTLKDAEQHVLDERRALMNRFALAVMTGDAEAKRSAIEAIKQWNRKPYARAVPITGDTLTQSLKARARNAAKREDGVLIPDPELGHLLRELMPAHMY